MPDAIGPTFPGELEAAGLLGLPFSWGADGSLYYDPRMTPEQIAAVEAVVAAHDPTATMPPPNNPTIGPVDSGGPGYKAMRMQN
jgi:hypothetical protein